MHKEAIKMVNKHNQIENTLNHLFNDSKNDRFKIIKGFSKSMFRPIQPSDFKDAYLSISKEQGENLKSLIIEKNFRNIVEFGTSFGISTIYLAQGAKETKGKIITTELIDSKAKRAIENFKNAGVNDLIELRIGDAMETLKNHKEPIDLLFLDGWKDLYLPLFQLLESNFHDQTAIYVDNADMSDTKVFLSTISKSKKYHFQALFEGKVVLLTLKKNRTKN